MWNALRPDVKARLQDELLGALQTEPSRKERLSLCDLVAAIALELSEAADAGNTKNGGENAWPALWQLVQTALQSADPNVQEVGFTLVERLANIVGGSMPRHIPTFQQIFMARLTDGAVPMSLRVAVARATVGVFLFLPDTATRKTFAAVLPPLLQNLHAASMASEAGGVEEKEEHAEVLSGLIAEATEDQDIAPLFKPFLPQAVQMMAAVAGDARRYKPVRVNCVLALLNIAEAAPSICRKMAGHGHKGAFLSALLPVLFGMATEWGQQDDDWLQTWEQGDDETDAEEEDVEGFNVDCGLDCLGRLARALGAEHMRHPFLAIIQQYMAARAPQDWPKRYAVMAAFAECPQMVDEDRENQKAAAEQLSTIVRTDPSSKVRAAAMTAFLNIIDSQTPTFQEHTHATTMPAILAALADGCKRVRTTACMCVMAYSSNLDSIDSSVSLTPYVDQLVPALIAAMNSVGSGSAPADRKVRESSITAIACIGIALTEECGRFYQGMRDGLLALLNQQEPPAPTAGGATPEERKLRQEQERSLYHVRLMKGKALECLSVLGQAAGKDIFKQDALACLSGVVGILQALQAEKAAKEAAAAGTGTAPVSSSADNPIQSYVWDTLGRLAKVLGQDAIAPYLPTILPPLLHAAAANTAEVVDADDDDGDVDEDEDEGEDGGAGGVAHVQKGDGTVIKVRTAELEDKASALSALAAMFTEMNRAQRLAGGGKIAGPSIMFGSTPAVLEVARGLIRDGGPHLEEIRRISVDCADELLVCLASGLTAPAVLSAAVELASAAVQPGALPPNLTNSPPHVYVAQLYGLVTDMTQALNEELDESLEFIQHLARAINTVMLQGCARCNFVGEPAAHELADNAIGYLPLFPRTVMEKIMTDLKAALRTTVQRRIVRAQEAKIKKAENELDEDEEEEVDKRNEDDALLISTITTCFGACLRIGGSPYVTMTDVLPSLAAQAPIMHAWEPFNRIVLPEYQLWAAPGADKRDVCFVVSLAVDVLEFAGDALLSGSAATGAVSGSESMLSAMFHIMLDGMKDDKDMESQQAGAYGCGAIARKLKPLWPQFLSMAVQRCGEVIARCGSKDGSVRDTAAASVLLMAEHIYPHAAPAAARTPGFHPRHVVLHNVFKVLPLQEDPEEAKNAVEVLLAMLMRRDPDAFGMGDVSAGWGEREAGHLLATLRQMAFVLGMLDVDDVQNQPHSSDAAMARGITSCLRWLSSAASAVPAQVMTHAFNGLVEDEKKALTEAMA